MKGSCPICGGETAKIIYLGLPGRFCFADNAMMGLSAYAPCITFETMQGPMTELTVYQGGYWPALWRWLTHWGDDGS